MRQFVRVVCGVFLLFFAQAGVCQQNATPNQNQPPTQTPAKLDWREAWRDATIAFGEVAHDQLVGDYFHALGTGVIVSTDSRTGYLVTARHVFCDPNKRFHPSQLRVRFAWQEHKSIYSYLGVPFTLRDSSGANLWSSLDDGSDVAAMPLPNNIIDLIPPEDRLKSYNSVSIGDVSSDVYEGEPVFVFGYPGIVGNEKLVRPIWRQGIVAWTNPNQPDDNVFLIDANVYPGNSGGPVIKFPTGLRKDGLFDYFTASPLKLLGIVSEAPGEEIKTTTVDPRLKKFQQTDTQITVGAIGFIEPGSKIRKLIELMQQGKAQPPVCDVPDPVQEKPPAATTPR
jgi:hypothetical protein